MISEHGWIALGLSIFTGSIKSLSCDFRQACVYVFMWAYC